MIMSEKVLVNREALDKLLQYVYKDEERDWSNYKTYESLYMYDASQIPVDHIFWSIRQLCCDAGWFDKAIVRKIKKTKRCKYEFRNC